MSIGSTGKGVLLQGAGWVLVVVGLAALVLPGPGLLALFAGMAILATQYEWAARHLDPVKKAALRAAEGSVKTWPHIVISLAGAFAVIGIGAFWGIRPPAPSWWPADDSWWLVGGWKTGSSLIGSGVIALGLLAYSYVRFRRR